MALTTNKKNKIIADWQVGRFKSEYAIAKHYKISPHTIKKILKDIDQSEADVVELGVTYEKEKKRTKNAIVEKAIENSVKERTIADEIQDIVMSATKANVKAIKKVIKSGKAAKVVKEGNGGGMTTARVVSFNMGPEHYKQAQEGLDKALITAGKAARHAPRGDVHVGDNNVTGVIEYIIEMPVEDKIDEVDIIEVEPIKDDDE